MLSRTARLPRSVRATYLCLTAIFLLTTRAVAQSNAQLPGPSTVAAPEGDGSVTVYVDANEFMNRNRPPTPSWILRIKNSSTNFVYTIDWVQINSCEKLASWSCGTVCSNCGYVAAGIDRQVITVEGANLPEEDRFGYRWGYQFSGHWTDTRRKPATAIATTTNAPAGSARPKPAYTTGLYQNDAADGHKADAAARAEEARRQEAARRQAAAEQARRDSVNRANAIAASARLEESRRQQAALAEQRRQQEAQRQADMRAQQRAVYNRRRAELETEKQRLLRESEARQQRAEAQKSAISGLIDLAAQITAERQQRERQRVAERRLREIDRDIADLDSPQTSSSNASASIVESRSALNPEELAAFNSAKQAAATRDWSTVATVVGNLEGSDLQPTVIGNTIGTLAQEVYKGCTQIPIGNAAAAPCMRNALTLVTHADSLSPQPAGKATIGVIASSIAKSTGIHAIDTQSCPEARESVQLFELASRKLNEGAAALSDQSSIEEVNRFLPMMVAEQRKLCGP